MKRAIANVLLTMAERVWPQLFDVAAREREETLVALQIARSKVSELEDKLSDLTLETELARLDSRATAMAVENPFTRWPEGSAMAFRHFLDSDHGRNFSTRLRTVAAEVAVNGANDQKNTVHSAGVSAGWNECVRYIHSLSRVSGEQDTPRVGASDSKYGQQPEDEAALVERLSP